MSGRVHESSPWPRLRRAMLPAEMEDWEWRAFRQAVQKVLDEFPIPDEGVHLRVPGVTVAGKAYLVTLLIKVRPCRVAAFAVDLDPDLSSGEFDAYVDKRAEWERESA